MLLLCSINTQSFVHDKSSSTSQFIKDKSKDLQKLIRYLSRINNSTFKEDTSGCAGWSVSPGFPVHGRCADAFWTSSRANRGPINSVPSVHLSATGISRECFI